MTRTCGSVDATRRTMLQNGLPPTCFIVPGFESSERKSTARFIGWRRSSRHIPSINVEICIRNASLLYGHVALQDLADHPSNSATLNISSSYIPYYSINVRGVDLLKAPIAKQIVHHLLFLIICATCSTKDRPKMEQKTIPAASEGR